MPQLRPEEEWAAQLLRSAGAAQVEQHDDGSAPGMYDLDFWRRDGAHVAVEVVRAASEEELRLWAQLGGRLGRWIEPSLAGGWVVHVHPSAAGRDVRRELPAFLADHGSRWGNGVARRRAGASSVFETRAAALRISEARQGGTAYAGSIYPLIDLPLERTATYQAATGDALAVWLGEYLAAPEQADVVRKLNASGVPQRHAFVIVPSSTPALASVVELLTRDDPPLPTIDPVLPVGLTGLWAVSIWDVGCVYYWSAEDGWKTFPKKLSEPDPKPSE